MTTEDECMPFMIGAHPAFMCPLTISTTGGECRRTGCFVNFHTNDERRCDTTKEPIKILFVCHGNICRSPIAEFFFRDYAEKHGLKDRYEVASAAVSTEEIYRGVGNLVYPPAKAKLLEHGISCEGKRARLMTKEDYRYYDLLIGMDALNLRRMENIAGGDPDHKMWLLLDFADTPRDVSDSWYTGDFETAYQDIVKGCTALIDRLTFKNHLVLASGSPRRRELLAQIGIEFSLDPSDVDEFTSETIPDQYVEELSFRKASSVIERHQNDWILGADTAVSCEGKILGKPKDKKMAEKMLTLLSGNTHQVYTGVSIIRTYKGKILYRTTLSVSTDVTFYPLSEQGIQAYIETGEPFDKAGSYGIQGKGAVLVKEIRGDYNNVVGLPISTIYRVLY